MAATTSSRPIGSHPLHASCFVMPNPSDAGSRACSRAWVRGAGNVHRRIRRHARPSRREVTVTKSLRACARDPRSDRSAGVGGPGEGLRRRADDAAVTIRMAAGDRHRWRLIEDANGNPRAAVQRPLADERVAAAVEAARRFPFPFTLTARRELPARQPDLDDTIRRSRHSRKPAPMCCSRPASPTSTRCARYVSSLSRPFHFMAGSRKVVLPCGARSRRVGRDQPGDFPARAAMAGLREGRRKVKKISLGYVDATMPTRTETLHRHRPAGYAIAFTAPGIPAPLEQLAPPITTHRHRRCGCVRVPLATHSRRYRQAADGSASSTAIRFRVGEVSSSFIVSVKVPARLASLACRSCGSLALPCARWKSRIYRARQAWSI